MRILITGGAGCLGSNLIEHWLPKGHEILVIDNFATGKREVVPAVPGLTVREGSVADAQLVDECVLRLFRPDVVIHAAAAYKDPDDWPEDSTNECHRQHLSSRRAAQAFTTSGAWSISRPPCATADQQELPIPASHPTAPFTSYGITKTAGEQFLLLSGVPTLSLRIANVTGPRLAIGPIPTFYKRLQAGQSCFCSETSRDFSRHGRLSRLSWTWPSQPDAPTGVFNLVHRRGALDQGDLRSGRRAPRPRQQSRFPWCRLPRTMCPSFPSIASDAAIEGFRVAGEDRLRRHDPAPAGLVRPVRHHATSSRISRRAAGTT
jgi:UDP-glucose 4-epimerase